MSLPAVPPASSPIRLPIPRRALPGPSGSYARPDVRIGDAERTAVCESLSIHFAEGRLSPDELDTRLEAAARAVMLADLRRLTTDLPDLAGPAPAAPGARAATIPGPPTGPTPLDVLIGVGMVGAMGLIMVMLFGIGMVNPALFLASAVGGTLALGVGAGGTHLCYRALRRRG